MENDNVKLMSIDEACRQLGLGRCSIYKLINQNRLKTVKIGSRRLVSQNAIQAFIANLEAGGDVRET